MNQDKVEEEIFQMGFSVRLPPSHIKPSAHHQCPPSQTAGKDDAKNPNSSRVASPRNPLVFTLFHQRQILKDFPAQPPTQGAAWGREDPASLDGDRKDTRFPSEQGDRGRNTLREIWKKWPRQGFVGAQLDSCTHPGETWG